MLEAPASEDDHQFNEHEEEALQRQQRQAREDGSGHGTRQRGVAPKVKRRQWNSKQENHVLESMPGEESIHWLGMAAPTAEYVLDTN